IRIGYPSAKLLRTLPAHRRSDVAGTIVLALTANPYYNLDGVAPGDTLGFVKEKLKLGKTFAIGRNDWYIIRGQSASGVLKVRRGIVDEIGIATKRLTLTRGAQQRLLTSFGADGGSGSAAVVVNARRLADPD